jgi:hypothetical protein
MKWKTILILLIAYAILGGSIAGYEIYSLVK